MGILLTILKIIGITLLIILALLIVILLGVLFVPIRYKVNGAYKESFRLQAKITWAFPIISVKALFDEELSLAVRILGIKLPLFKDMPSKVEIEKEKHVFTEKAESSPENEASPSSSLEETPQDSPLKGTKTENKTSAETENTKKQEKKEKKNIFARIKDFICNIISKIKEIKAKINYYIQVLKSDTAKAAFAVCKKRIIKLFKCILPRKGRVNVRFGMEDPATTGQIMGWHGMFYPIIGNLIFLYPDFEKPCMECDFFVKGKIRPGCVLYQVVRVLFDKNCRKLMRLLKGR